MAKSKGEEYIALRKHYERSDSCLVSLKYAQISRVIEARVIKFVVKIARSLIQLTVLSDFSSALS